MAHRGHRLAKCNYCVAEGPSTQLKCVNCEEMYCGACQQSKQGPLLVKNASGKHVLRCASCHKNPKVVAKASPRKDWEGGDARLRERPLTYALLLLSVLFENHTIFVFSYQIRYHLTKNRAATDACWLTTLLSCIQRADESSPER
jgi:hypothetical protein